ncbi:MAG TPA: IS1595 family transposase [Xanthobacteraceae bacterium]
MPLRTWFAAIFLTATSSKGISAMVLSRQLDLGYKTAWFLAHRIRNLMPQDWEALRGMVEVDEAYLGGKRTTKRASKRDPDNQQPKGRGGSRKSMVMVAVERGKRGKARAKRGGPHGARTIATFVYSNVERSSVLLTDDLPAYRWIGRKFPAHLAVNHSRGEYVRRDPLAAATAHVNTAESFNAVLKRCWVGVHHWWSSKHSHRYLNQLVFHWHHRGTSPDTRLAHLFRASGRRLRFRDCIA